ncbi:MAG: ArsC family reductase [Sideroxyarcus sp.]|nr:ArsC family reductase [Sideroxyarcus sp.]
MKLYGIPNCGTVKKARAWLDERGAEYQFVDYKKQQITQDLLAGWMKQVGWQKLLKKTGPTWGKLPDAVKASITNEATALSLMLEQPNVIKRPVLERKGKVLATGFNQTDYENLDL